MSRSLGVFSTELGAHTTIWKHQLSAGASGGGLSVDGEHGRVLGVHGLRSGST